MGVGLFAHERGDPRPLPAPRRCHVDRTSFRRPWCDRAVADRSAALATIGGEPDRCPVAIRRIVANMADRYDGLCDERPSRAQFAVVVAVPQGPPVGACHGDHRGPGGYRPPPAVVPSIVRPAVSDDAGGDKALATAGALLRIVRRDRIVMARLAALDQCAWHRTCCTICHGPWGWLCRALHACGYRASRLGRGGDGGQSGALHRLATSAAVAAGWLWRLPVLECRSDRACAGAWADFAGRSLAGDDAISRARLGISLYARPD